MILLNGSNGDMIFDVVHPDGDFGFVSIWRISNVILFYLLLADPSFFWIFERSLALYPISITLFLTTINPIGCSNINTRIFTCTSILQALDSSFLQFLFLVRPLI